MLNSTVDTLLPTTMVGSYPRPHWFTYQLHGRDIWDAFKDVNHAEAFEDAVRTVLQRPGAGRAGYSDGRSDVVRRLRRLHRVFCLVLV